MPSLVPPVIIQVSKFQKKINSDLENTNEKLAKTNLCSKMFSLNLYARYF